VTVVEPPTSMAFAGPMGTSAARWGMELEPAGDAQTDALMWVEVDLAGIMRAVDLGHDALLDAPLRASDSTAALIATISMSLTR